MSEVKTIRIAKVAGELNVGIHTVVEHLKKAGHDVENKPTAKLTEEMYHLLLRDFQKDVADKEKAEKVTIGAEHKDVVLSSAITAPKKEAELDEVLIKSSAKEAIAPKEKKEKPKPAEKEEPLVEKAERTDLGGLKVVGKVDLTPKPKQVETPPDPVVEPAIVEVKEVKKEKEPVIEPEMIKTERIQLTGPRVVGRMELPVEKIPEKKEKPQESYGDAQKRKRKRIVKQITLKEGEERRPDGAGARPGQGGFNRPGQGGFNRPGQGGFNRPGQGGFNRPRTDEQQQVSEKEIQDKIKSTLAKLGKLGTSTRGKGVKSRIKRQRKEDAAAVAHADSIESANVIQVTEFISVSELASLMNVSATEVISKCLKLGIMVSINQRVDAEVIELVADEFKFKVKFISIADQMEEDEDEDDAPEDLVTRAPIVTVMGHVDHGKTSLLDFIRSTNVISQEAGGITQHIGAHEVTTESGRKVVFLDTPGHEAFTAMRARGAKVTDVAVIVIAADDAVMPQTREAISHAQAANVPMIFAINKIDKEGAQPEKIREQLANMNLLVEEWGGKFQSQEISAKKGLNIDKLLDKILLESDMLELKANPERHATGTVIEATLDKGRGYVATLLVQNGTLHVGDIVVSGTNMGKVKAMFNEKSEKRTEAGPSSASLILGLNGAPQAGESFKVFEDEQDAKEVTNKRDQIIREQGLRTKKHITLDEIGRRLALGTFKELNVIVKADVDGSVQALSDSLQKLSTQEIVVNVVLSAVGQITESDVLLASASDAIIIGFNVRPSVSARKLAEKENIEIRLYSIIYDAIDQIKTAMEGLLEPTIQEKVTGTAEVKEVFKVSKIGTVAGSQVVDGKITNKSKIRLVRNGIVVYTGVVDTLKRFKDEAREVLSGQECGIFIKDYNDIKAGDLIESYEETEVKRTL